MRTGSIDRKAQILQEKRRKFERTKLLKIASDPTFMIKSSEHLTMVLEQLMPLLLAQDPIIYGHLNQLDDISC